MTINFISKYLYPKHKYPLILVFLVFFFFDRFYDLISAYLTIFTYSFLYSNLDGILNTTPMSFSKIFTNFQIIIDNIWIIVGMAFLEEVLFRVPITYIYKFKSDNFKFFLIIFLSFIFATQHVVELNIFELFAALYKIAPFAMIASYLYIYSGGNKGKILFPLFVVFVFHLLNNFVVFLFTETQDLLKLFNLML